jgi:hypothetical protein
MGENDNNVYGASKTNMMTDPYAASLGVLSGGKGAEVQALLNSLMPEPEKVDAAQLAIRFFSQMGANAAQPGSTALSAAASALPSAANYLAEVNKRNRELERARGPLAIQLATAMKPKTSTAPVKVMVDGKAVYMSAAEAIKRGLPVYEKDTNTNKAPKAYSVTEENLALLNKKLGLNLTRDTLGNVLLTPSQFTLGQNFVGPEVKEDTSSSKPTILKLYDSLKSYKIGTDEYDAVLLEIQALQNKAGFDKERFGAEKDLRVEWNKVNYPYAEVRANYNKLVAALTPKYDKNNKEIKDDTKGVGDMAAVFLFMKMLDPGSVVRESEFQAAQATAGIMDRLGIKVSQLKKGDILSPAQREDFLNLAKEFMDAGSALKNETRLNLGQAVDNYSLTPQNIFGVETAPPWFYLNPDVFNSANKKNTTIDAMWKNMTEKEREAYSPSSGEK